MKVQILGACLASVSAAALLTASPAAAQTFSGREATRILLPFSILNSTPEGRAALTANLAAVVSINNTSTTARRAEAVTDNTLVLGGGSIAPGLGTKLNAVFQANFSSSNAVLGTTGAVGAILRQFPGLALSDAVTAKNFYAFGGIDTKSVAPVPVFNGLSLPAGGIFDLYDVVYGVNPLYSKNPNGNTRPYALPNTQIQIFSTAQGGSNDSSAAFPSGHATLGAAEAILMAQMTPERYGDLLYRASEEGHSRLVLGVHYPTDVIGGRILSTYEMVQLLSNNPNFTGIVTGGSALVADRAAQLASATTAFRNMLEAGCGGAIASCIGAFDPTSETAFRAQKADYLFRLTYGVPAVGPTNLAPIVPVDAEVLLASRFPYLSAAQRRDVLASTETASGSVLDNGEGWARLNLFDASNGYAAFTAPTTVTLNAALGGFNAFDVWRNNIGGSGSLTKAGSGVLVLTGVNSWAGSTTIGGGELRITSFGSLPATTALTNAAVLSLADSNPAGRVKVATYTGSAGSTLVLDVSLTGLQNADRLTVTSAAGGSTAIVLNDLTASEKNGFNLGPGLLLVESPTASGFTLTGGKLSKGLFDYALASNAQGISLVSAPSSAAQRFASIPAALEEIWSATSEPLRDHEASLRDGKDVEQSLWLSAFSRSTDVDGAGGEDSLDPQGLVAGVDTRVRDLSPFGGALRLGVMGGVTQARQDFAGSTSTFKYNGGTVGVSAALDFPSGLFLNAMVKQDFLDLDTTVNELTPPGSGDLSTDVDIFGAALAAGYTMPLSETAFVEPSVSVAYANGVDDLASIAGHKITWDSGTGLRFKFGVRGGITLGEGLVATGEIASLHASSDDATTRLIATGYPTAEVIAELPDQVTEVRAGLQYEAGDWTLLGKGAYRTGSAYKSTEVNVTIRRSF